MKKKFKVRVKHFAQDKYEIQFASYYIVPIFHSFQFWFQQSLTSGTECWSTILMNFKDAEYFAKNFKSFEDVKKFYEKDKAKEKEFYKSKKAYYEKNVPYNTKYL